jgi:hypothetical protein
VAYGLLYLTAGLAPRVVDAIDIDEERAGQEAGLKPRG